MQRYVQTLIQQRNEGPVRPETDLLDRMADMQLDNAELSRPPAGRSSPRARPQNPPRRSRRPPPTQSYRENPNECESDSDEGTVPLPGHTIITTTYSQNVNTTTVFDSH